MKAHEIKRMQIARLNPADYNPRKISGAALTGLTASLRRFGLVQPIVWNKRTKRVVGGHQRIKALQAVGQTEADVVVLDIPENEEKALNVALNNPAIEGEFTDGLQGILDELRLDDPNLFSELRLDTLLLDQDPNDGSSDPDEVPDPPKTPLSKRGDVWILGQHRLLCGDSTDPAVVGALLGKRGANMAFTDPPWNVAIGQDSNPSHRQREGLANDDLGVGFLSFIQKWSAACLPHLNGDLYCIIGASEWPVIDTALRGSSMHWSATIIWVKDLFVLGRSNYQHRFEPIWYGWPKKGRSSYQGERDQDDVWEYPRPKVSEEHPTMKPVALVEKAIVNSSKRTDIVFDPFLGSGSTLIAAERHDRICYGIEIDPRFCDVIVQRWETFTGKKARLK